MKKVPETRIVREGNQYYPEYKGLFFWKSIYILGIDNKTEYVCTTNLAAAEHAIDKFIYEFTNPTKRVEVIKYP